MIVAVRGDQRAQVVTKVNVYCRTVIDRANTDLEERISRLTRCVGKQVSHRARDFTRIDIAAARTEYAKQISRAAQVNSEVRIEDRGHQNRAAFMRLEGRILHLLWIGQFTQRRAQRLAHSACLAKLLR